jgi:CHASE3 domain sensor protein
MKKTLFIFLAVATTWLFTACTGVKKTEEAPATEPEKTEVQPVVETPAPVELAPAEMLKAFQAFAKEYGEAYNNVVKDPQKYTTLASQVQEKMADMERIKGKLTTSQIKEYDKAMRIIRDVSAGGSKPKK